MDLCYASAAHQCLVPVVLSSAQCPSPGGQCALPLPGTRWCLVPSNAHQCQAMTASAKPCLLTSLSLIYLPRSTLTCANKITAAGPINPVGGQYLPLSKRIIITLLQGGLNGLKHPHGMKCVSALVFVELDWFQLPKVCHGIAWNARFLLHSYT